MRNASEKRDVAMELKYCEQCGALWVRPHGDDERVCGGCRGAMSMAPRRWSHALKQKQALSREWAALREVRPTAAAIDAQTLEWMDAKGGVA